MAAGALLGPIIPPLIPMVVYAQLANESVAKLFVAGVVPGLLFASGYGVYVERPEGTLSLRWVKAPTSAELTALAGRIASRVGRFLERQGLLERDAENPCLSELALDDEPMQALLAHSIIYRIAVGPRAGRR